MLIRAVALLYQESLSSNFRHFVVVSFVLSRSKLFVGVIYNKGRVSCHPDASSRRRLSLNVMIRAYSNVSLQNSLRK